MTASPHLIEPEINNEILNLLIPSTVPNNEGITSEKRPEFYVEDKIQPENLKVMEMQIINADPMASNQSSRPELETNDIELSDQAYEPGHSYKKMSIHIGDDAALFLAKIQVQSDQPDESHHHSIDVSKIKPTFKWKIGLWTRVKYFNSFFVFYYWNKIYNLIKSLVCFLKIKCSVRCDGGTRVRDVSCYEITTSTLVDDALCTDFKPDDVESCNEVKSSVKWYYTIVKYIFNTEPLYGVGVDTLDTLFFNLRIRCQNPGRQVS